MSLEQFENHLKDVAPGIRCFAVHDKKQELAFVAKIVHEIGPPAHALAQAELQRIVPDASPEFLEFYERHDGLVLYRDTIARSIKASRYSEASEFFAAGIRFFTLSELEEVTAVSRSQYESSNGDMPGKLRAAIVFAEICNSGNCFVHFEGGIYYANHDDWNQKPIAGSFSDFLKLIYSDPPEFLFRCGCYTRYSDGVTSIQWVPKEYVSDVTKWA